MMTTQRQFNIGRQVIKVISFDTWAYHIDKPIYGLFVAVRDKILDTAIKHKKYLLLTCPGGEEKVNPTEWKKKAKMFKKEYLIPGKPMIFYQNFIQPKKSAEELEQLHIMQSLGYYG